MIRVSSDLSGLQYCSKKSGMLKIWKDIKFTDLKGILYGGVSMTFKYHKKTVINDMNKQRWE